MLKSLKLMQALKQLCVNYALGPNGLISRMQGVTQKRQSTKCISKKKNACTMVPPTTPPAYQSSNKNVKFQVQPVMFIVIECTPSEHNEVNDLSIGEIFTDPAKEVDTFIDNFQHSTVPLDLNEEFPLEDSLNKWTFEYTESAQDIESLCDNFDIPEAGSHHHLSQGEWAPYPSKAMFLADVLFNSPRLHFSELEKKMVLCWGKDIGAPDIPTLSGLEKIQNSLNEATGNPTTEKQTHQGNIFYISEISSAIAKDLANPLVHPHLTFYPQRNEDGKFSQVWHGSKWLSELPDDLLTPMAIHPNGEHFYTEELCECVDGSLFIPQRWFSKSNNKLWASSLNVNRTPNGLVVASQDIKEYALERLWFNYLALGGEKKSNFLEFNLRFVGSSPHITVLELAQGVCESFKATTTEKIGYDCLNRSECIFRVMPYINATDNPMQAELCSQSGSQLYKCGDGYLDLFVAGELRTPQKTREIIDGQFTRAMQPRSQTMVESFVKEHGIKDTIAQPLIEHFTRSANELFLTEPNKEKIWSILKQKYDELKKEGNFQNPLLEMLGLNVHLDCPTEILHTVLLGVVKYFWGQTVWRWSQHSSHNGCLHWKTLVIYDLIHADLLVQIMVPLVLVYDLLFNPCVSRCMVASWSTCCFVLAYEIEDIDMYIEELELVIDQFLTKVAQLYGTESGYCKKHLPSLIVLSTSLAGDIGMTNQQGKNTIIFLVSPKTVMSEPEALFYEGQSIITQNRDVAKLGSVVIVQDAGIYLLGQINQILRGIQQTDMQKLDLPVLVLTENYKEILPKKLNMRSSGLQKAEQVRDKKAQAKELKETMNALGHLKKCINSDWKHRCDDDDQ
ncbi:hypothetical protein Clacol_004445 [Clathrus columnatus]|uniref:Uncharacterized protein n=1 Tax=Clathrus columnatus TaxID=1419009 RepID=A0AAV5AAG6_9AGAM|nr:hypothetical protein Clacol_004445 [Clathrus columnatus]